MWSQAGEPIASGEVRFAYAGSCPSCSNGVSEAHMSEAAVSALRKKEIQDL